MKHTPGPWEVMPERPWVVIMPEGADSGEGQKYASVGGGNIEANAKLIAAAPELLEDLESRYVQTKCGCGHPACNRCEDDRETERVLRKAKGGEEWQ